PGSACLPRQKCRHSVRKSSRGSSTLEYGPVAGFEPRVRQWPRSCQHVSGRSARPWSGVVSDRESKARGWGRRLDAKRVEHGGGEERSGRPPRSHEDRARDLTMRANRWMAAAVIAVSVSVSGVSAQEGGTPGVPPNARPLSLEEALAAAGVESEEIAVAEAGVLSADAEVQRATAARLPQLGASASYSRTLASQFEGLGG